MTYRRSAHPLRSISSFDDRHGMETDTAAKWLQKHDAKLNRSRNKARKNPQSTQRRKPKEGAHT
jgi:hypothetical protein